MIATAPIRTVAELVKHLGGVPLSRIRVQPYPATVADVRRLIDHEDMICELVDGVLVEKAMSQNATFLTIFLAEFLNAFVRTRNLGYFTGPDGAVELMGQRVRIPDLSFFAWDSVPGRQRPTQPIPNLAPDLAIEVLSPSNTPGEMEAKRFDYFAAGVVLVWEIDPDARTALVYTSPTDVVTLGPTDALDGGAVLPGFRLPVAQLFAELDRKG